METRVVPATLDHLPALRTVLVRALADDPMFHWFFPAGAEPDELRASRVAMYLGPQVEWQVATGTSFVALDGERVVGGALWKEPGLPRPDVLPAMGTLHRILVAPALVPVTVAGMVAARAEAPQVTGAYLSVLGVDPDAQGRGVGAALMGAAGQRWPGTRWLETTNERNHAFYERCGYRAVHRASLGDSGETLTRFVAGDEGRLSA